MTRTIVAVEAITLDENTDYAQLLRSLMGDAGITSTDLARAVGRSRDVIATWRWGRRAPGVVALVQLADAFGYELVLAPKAEPIARPPEPAPEPEKPVDHCPASTSGLCLSMTEGFAVCEPDECVHHESGQRVPEESS